MIFRQSISRGIGDISRHRRRHFERLMTRYVSPSLFGGSACKQLCASAGFLVPRGKRRHQVSADLLSSAARAIQSSILAPRANVPTVLRTSSGEVRASRAYDVMLAA